MNKSIRNEQNPTLLLLALTLLALLVWRLALMALLPLADSTEARYGEIARLMIESGNWLMPYADSDSPFFAKPAFSFWMSAAVGRWFGVSEFTLRFAHFFAMCLAFVPLWLLLANASRVSRFFALVSAAMCPLVFISAGAVMTDAAQLAAVSWAMYFSWQLLKTPQRLNDRKSARTSLYLFYVCLAIGALVKGLATVALICMPLALFGISGGLKHFVKVFWRLFSVPGIVIFLALTVPYFALAEHSYPGFLDYFILGEHVKRFLEPGWQGDRYGNAHRQAYGTIWLFWAGAILPWLITFFLLAWAQVRHYWIASKRQSETDRDVIRFAWCFVLAPLVFFSFASNIIWTYALTAIPGFVWLLALWFDQRAKKFQKYLAAVCSVLTAIAIALLSPTIIHHTENRSARDLIEEARKQGFDGSQPIVVAGVYQFSSRFYTHENVDFVDDSNTLNARHYGGRYAIVRTTSLNDVKANSEFDALASNDRATLIRIR